MHDVKRMAGRELFSSGNTLVLQIRNGKEGEYLSRIGSGIGYHRIQFSSFSTLFEIAQ